MEETNTKKESKFIDNVAYKNKFQFIIEVNNNVICQRYFKINGFNEESIHSAEFTECMNGIVESIKKDLESKSRIYMWYNNHEAPFKLRGFASDADIEKYGSSLFSHLTDDTITGDVVTEDGRVFTKEYIDYNNDIFNVYVDDEQDGDDDFLFKFTFLIDDVPAYERIWDGKEYPRFIRNGVDLTNTYSNYTDNNSFGFANYVIRRMQVGKPNLISDFIRRICDTLSNTFTNEYGHYTSYMDVMTSNNKVDKVAYENAIQHYNNESNKVNILGHIDIPVEKKHYSYSPTSISYMQGWKKSVEYKTKAYYSSVSLSKRQTEYIDKFY